MDFSLFPSLIFLRNLVSMPTPKFRVLFLRGQKERSFGVEKIWGMRGRELGFGGF